MLLNPSEWLLLSLLQWLLVKRYYDTVICTVQALCARYVCSVTYRTVIALLSLLCLQCFDAVGWATARTSGP